MSDNSEYGEPVTVKATPEQRAEAKLLELVENGKLTEALRKAKKMRAERQATQKADRQSRALEIIEQTRPGEPLDLDGIIETLNIKAAYAEDEGDLYEGLFKPVSEIKPFLPQPILGANGSNGAVLTTGNVCILSGQGGVAKTTLTASIALSFAACTQMESSEMMALKGEIFRGIGGRVMIASFEESANTMSHRMNGLAKIWQEQGRDNRIERSLKEKVLCANLPDSLFKGEGFDLPRPTRAWDCLWETANRFKPKLIVIDPIIGAYIGDGNNPARVFAFVKSLAREAATINAGVLLVGHSNKAARQSANSDPFDAGHIAGTSAWTDAARGVMILTKDKGNEGKTTLAISKANFGPSYIEIRIKPIYRDGGGMPYGMEIDGAGWSQNTGQETKSNDEKKGANSAVF
ncbi:MAG: AAA family ATPase [Gemmatimonadota bacterium]|nr:AAA family ATPase [Gemmatimonadota bacterium]